MLASDACVNGLFLFSGDSCAIPWARVWFLSRHGQPSKQPQSGQGMIILGSRLVHVKFHFATKFFEPACHAVF